MVSATFAAVTRYGKSQYALGETVAEMKMREELDKAVAQWELDMKLLAQSYEADRARLEALAKERQEAVDKLVEKAQYKVQCFDDEGVSIVNNAIKEGKK